MKYPKVVFSFRNIKQDAEYICFLAKSITNGDFQRGGFLVLENKNHIVNFDKIAHELWDKDFLEKFSFYSISKIIENIRNKIRSFGINKEVIITARGKGYLLKD